MTLNALQPSFNIELIPDHPFIDTRDARLARSFTNAYLKGIHLFEPLTDKDTTGRRLQWPHDYRESDQRIFRVWLHPSLVEEAMKKASEEGRTFAHYYSVDLDTCSCTCPMMERKDLYCKHTVAVAHWLTKPYFIDREGYFIFLDRRHIAKYLKEGRTMQQIASKFNTNVEVIERIIQ